MAHPDGERATARGAAAAGALMTVSTAASTVAGRRRGRRARGPEWFQLYALHSPAHTDELARRAGEAGYRALVLTVDLPVLGRRLRDLRSGFLVPADPPNLPHDGSPAEALPGWTFDDIGRFGELSGLPVVVKGVLRDDDAARCVAGRGGGRVGVRPRRAAGRSGGRQRRGPARGGRPPSATTSRCTSTAGSGPAPTS